MKFGILAFAFLFGAIGYAHVTDNMGLPHVTGIAVALIAAIVCIAIMAFWLMKNDKALRQADLHRRKKGK